MKELVGDKHILLEDLKDQCETIRSAREEKRKKVCCYKKFNAVHLSHIFMVVIILWGGKLAEW